MTERRFRLGATLTALWLGGMLALVIGTWPKSCQMPLNEWGDFFAGTFAPVAFLWLVLGYLQQGEELRLSTEALRLQADELRASVEQQRQLVEVSREQVASEREALAHERQERELAARPSFSLSGGGCSYRPDASCTYSFILSNTGNAAAALLVDVVVPGEGPRRILDVPLFERGRQHGLNFPTMRPIAAGGQLLLMFADTLGKPHNVVYSMERETESPQSPLTFRRIDA